MKRQREREPGPHYCGDPICFEGLGDILETSVYLGHHLNFNAPRFAEIDKPEIERQANLFPNTVQSQVAVCVAEYQVSISLCPYLAESL